MKQDLKLPLGEIRKIGVDLLRGLHALHKEIDDHCRLYFKAFLTLLNFNFYLSQTFSKILLNVHLQKKE